MFKSVAVAASSLILGCAAVILVGGCSNPQEDADRAAAKAVAAAEQQRATATDVASLDTVLSQYDTIARQTGLSPQMQIVVKGAQAQLRYEIATDKMAQLRAKEIDISRMIANLQQLGSRVAGAQASVNAIKEYDPTKTITALKAREDDIKGANGPGNWAVNADNNVNMPNLAAVNATIDKLNTAIETNKSQSQDLHKKSTDAMAEAETLSRKAEGETGSQQVDDKTKASDLTKDAGIADGQADTLASELVRLNTDLESAQLQKTTIETTLASIDAQISGMEASWKKMQDDIDAQQKLEQAIIGAASAPADTGDQSSPTVTITQGATQLVALLSDAAKARDDVSTRLEDVISGYEEVRSQAEKLRSDYTSQLRDKANDADAPIWRKTMETLHPVNYSLEKASALRAKASVAAGKAGIEQMLCQLLAGQDETDASTASEQFKNLHVTPGTGKLKVEGFKTLLSADTTGMPVPQPVDELLKSYLIDDSKLTQDRDDTYKIFKEAVDAFDTEAQSSPSEARNVVSLRQNVTLMGRANTYRQWAQFAMLFNDSDSGKKFLDQAKQLEDQVDPSFRTASGMEQNQVGGQNGGTPTGAAQ